MFDALLDGGRTSNLQTMTNEWLGRRVDWIELPHFVGMALLIILRLLWVKHNRCPIVNILLDFYILPFY